MLLASSYSLVVILVFAWSSYSACILAPSVVRIKNVVEFKCEHFNGTRQSAPFDRLGYAMQAEIVDLSQRGLGLFEDIVTSRIIAY